MKTPLAAPPDSDGADPLHEGAVRPLLDAVQALVGAAVILDAAGRVVISTPQAVELLGQEPAPGQSLEQAISRLMLDPGGVVRLCAATTARHVHTEVFLPSRGQRTGLRVRVEPIRFEADLRGFLLLLRREAFPESSAAPSAGRSAPPDAHVTSFHGIWTQAANMQQVFHIVARVAPSDVSVLVRGETGTGKELIARALHALSPRADGPLHALNCAALPENLLESELFGHVRGSFTGAIDSRPGHFRLAHGGTLFLDEVAELPLTVQAKLLRVLETRSVIPIGGREPIRVDVRLIAATHRALRREVEAGRFRADLMYRLRVVPIFLPPLRERPGDVTMLALRFCDELNEQPRGRQIVRISDAVKELFARYDWPGNVRELRNVLEYAYAVGEGPVLLVGDLPPELVDFDARPPGRPSGLAGEVAAAALPCDASSEIREALVRARGSAQRAAELLGISRITLWRRMKALGLTRGPVPRAATDDETRVPAKKPDGSRE